MIKKKEKLKKHQIGAATSEKVDLFSKLQSAEIESVTQKLRWGWATTPALKPLLTPVFLRWDLRGHRDSSPGHAGQSAEKERSGRVPVPSGEAQKKGPPQHTNPGWEPSCQGTCRPPCCTAGLGSQRPSRGKASHKPEIRNTNECGFLKEDRSNF